MKSIFGFVCLAILISAAFSVQGQSCRFSVGLVASVDSYIFQEPIRQVWQPEYEIKSTTRGSIGLSLHYRLGNRLVLKGAVLYSDKGYELAYKAPDNLRTDPAFIRPDKVKKGEDWLDVPVLVGFKVASKGKFSLVPAIGVVNGLQLRSTTTATFSDRPDYTSFSGDLQYSCAAAAELALSFQASERIQVGLAPYYRRVITNEMEFSKTKWLGNSFEVLYCF